MEIFSKDLVKSEILETRVRVTASFSGAKCEFIQGKILTVDKTNVSFIEPHRIIVTIKGKKLLLLYFDNDNLFLYNRSMPIDTKQLSKLLNAIKSEVQDGK